MNLWILVQNILKIIQQGQIGDEDDEAVITIPEVYDIKPQMEEANSHHSGYGQPHHYEYGRPQDRHMYNPNNYARSDDGGGRKELYAFTNNEKPDLKENGNGNVVKEQQ